MPERSAAVAHGHETTVGEQGVRAAADRLRTPIVAGAAPRVGIAIVVVAITRSRVPDG